MLRDVEIKIAPSILSADFGRLGQQVEEAVKGGADYVHVDIMDGHFVPNLTIGPLVVRTIKPWSPIPLDVHLMISGPESYIEEFVDAGADIVTVHVEACPHMHRTIQQIKETGVKAGIAINPATPASILEDILPDVDQVLVMTVNPGFGGQAFIPGTVEKIRRVRSMLDQRGLSAGLEVDGGIGPTTADTVVRAGARVLVAGSAVYNDKSTVADSIAAIRSSIGS